ncbi:type II toxin-antitoxin system VapB family antitoxin [Salmonirosea aquatica]
MSVSEEIQEKASQLPPELQAEVLDFIQFLAFKKAKSQTTSQESFARLPNKFGAGKGLITYMAEDFDAPLDDLKDYMF